HLAVALLRPHRMRGPSDRALDPPLRTVPAPSRGAMIAAFLLGGLLMTAPDPAAPPEYRIQAIRYATIKDFPVSELVIGAPAEEKIDIAMVIWLIRGGGRNILFDSGFHREKWLKEFPSTADFLRPDAAVELAGVQAADVTDIIISHAHWDHIGG